MKKGDLGSSEVNVAKVPANSENRLLRAVQLHIAEPNVIEESMLREGIVSADYVPISSDRIKAMRNNNELHKVEALQLTFKNILQINNLQGFDALVKLQWDNNIIEKIENPETLVNLTWIDLSFNNIAVIEGLNSLAKLTDLSLCSKCITRLQGIDTLSSLNVLSVGKNQISSLDEVQYLRRFRNLKMLTLAGNAFPDADYRAFVIAHLSWYDWKEGGHLTALDYRLVETFSVSGAVSVSSAREQYQDTMLELADKEKMDSELAVLNASTPWPALNLLSRNDVKRQAPRT